LVSLTERVNEIHSLKKEEKKKKSDLWEITFKKGIPVALMTFFEIDDRSFVLLSFSLTIGRGREGV